MSKTTTKSAAQPAESPAEVQEVRQDVAQEVQETAASDMYGIVVLALDGTGPKMDAVWSKYCDKSVIVITGSDDVKKALESVMADEGIAQRFVLIPANLLPVCPVSVGELQSPFVYVGHDNGRRYWGLVPVSFDKQNLVDFLPDNDSLSDEEFVAKYVKTFAGRPNEVSYNYGNFITPAFRGTPCENVVIEAFVRKRFVYANAVAWPAIENLIDNYLLKR